MPISLINWQVEVEFAVDGRAQNVFGDGFAMWVTKERAEVGPVFGSRGESTFMTCLPSKWGLSGVYERIGEVKKGPHGKGSLILHGMTSEHRLGGMEGTTT